MTDNAANKEEQKNWQIQHLYETQKEIETRQTKILQTLNNGLKTHVRNNRENINTIKSDINEIKEIIISDEAVNEQRKLDREKIYWFVMILLALSQIFQIYHII
ncbi:MAG: hypothetical protein ACOCRO_00465 [Halanaerobiales bacterium]